MILGDHVRNLNDYIPNTTVPVSAKRRKVVTYLTGFLTIKLYNALITWPCKVT